MLQEETFTDHILKHLEDSEDVHEVFANHAPKASTGAPRTITKSPLLGAPYGHQHPLSSGYCQECRKQIQPRYYRAALILGDEGQAVSEYAILLSFLLLVVLASAMQVGNAVYNVFDRVGSHIFGHIR